MHRFRLGLILITLLLGPLGCADDTSRADGGNPGGDAAAVDGGSSDSGGGDTTAAKQKVEMYVPADNAVAGWVEDTTTGAQGVESGYTDADIEAIINGHHAPYAAEGTTGFAKQDYKKDDNKLMLEIWEMNTPAGAKNMFDKNKLDGETGAGLTFEPIAGVQEAAIITTSYDAAWRAYGHKGPYTWLLVATTPDPGRADAFKADVVAFATYLASQLP